MALGIRSQLTVNEKCDINVLMRDTIIRLMCSGYRVYYFIELLQNCISPIQINMGFCGPENKQRYFVWVCTAEALCSLCITN